MNKRNKTSVHSTNEAVDEVRVAENNPIDKLKDFLVTLMKGSDTIGKIFGTTLNPTTELSYNYIVETSPGVFEVENLQITTDVVGEFFIVFNVRGVESDYTHKFTGIKISEKRDPFTKIFNYIEPYFAFIVAAFVILSVSYGFPFWITPFALILILLFMVYAYQNVDSKGLIFIGLVYTFLIISGLFLVYVLFIRLFAKS